MWHELFGVQPIDLLLVVCALAFNLLICGIFITSKHGYSRLRSQLGIVFLLLALPLLVVFITYIIQGRAARMILGVGGALLYMLVEFLLDFVFKYDFRSRPSTHVPYIVLEYVALFGLLFASIGVHRTWGWIVGITFWMVMGSLIYLYWDKIIHRTKQPPTRAA